jgi:glucose/arabinose dehydrogenase
MTRKLNSTLAILALLSAAAASAWAQDVREFDTEKVKLQVEVIAGGIQNPWGLDFLPDGRVVVTERGEGIHVLETDGTLKLIEGVPEFEVRGQGGMLDVAASPDFDKSQLIYFTYAAREKGGLGTALARGRLVKQGDDYKLEGTKVLFTMNRLSRPGRHFGSRIVFAPDGTIFVTTGDRGDGKRAQNRLDHAGAVIRMNPDGSVPKDNPFAANKKAAPEIWSKGHRNIQGAAFDPLTKGLVTVEHGAKGGDEVNQPQAGKNYGWPIVSYGVDYSGAKLGVGTEAPGYVPPVYYWDPSIAPSGLVSYQGKMFPEWKDDLLVGALKFALLVRLDRDETGKIVGEERMLEGEYGRIRDVNVAPDGSIWLLTDETDGAVLRISRAD